MSGYLVCLVLGMAIGVGATYKYGHAHARAVRSWNDFRGNKQAMSGLFKRTIAEWTKAVKAGALMLLVIALVGWFVITHV